MKQKSYTVRDPISGYAFTIESPIPLLHKSSYAIHPAYTLDFSPLLKQCRTILLTHETFYNIQSKRLAFSALLFKLSETGILQFKQFSTLRLSYNFFNDKELITKFFFLVPKLLYSTPRLRRSLPQFRITDNQIGSIGPWIDLCISKLSDIHNAHTTLVEVSRDYLIVKPIIEKWKLYSTNKDKLPSKVIHYVYTYTTVPHDKRDKWRIFLTASAGELYLKHRIKSIESIDLFWELLDCVDHIECADFQDDITKYITKFLKKKIEVWVDWHPQFLELSLDYRLYTPKPKALENLKEFWVSHEKEEAEERVIREALAKEVEEKLRILKEKRAAERGHKAINTFTIMGVDNEPL